MSALMKAIKEGDFDTVQMIVNSRDFDAADPERHLPLHYASYIGNAKITELLLKGGMNINMTNSFGQTPMYVAINFGHLCIIELLIVNGVDINAPICSYGENALYFATKLGFLHIVKFLIARGADINLTHRIDKMTALHHASWKGQSHIVEFLVENGANINAENVDGYTSIHIACTPEIMNFLVKSLEPPYIFK